MAVSWIQANENAMKRGPKKKGTRIPRTTRGKLLKHTEPTRLEQPIQTALYAKLWRLGYEA